MTRTPSDVTLRIRAYAKAERLRAKIVAAEEAHLKRVKKHRERIEALKAELDAAEAGDE